MRVEIESFNFAEFKKSMAKTAEKYCWRGYRVLTSCPLCLSEVLTVEDTRLLVEAFASPQNFRLVEAFADAHNIGLLILVPSNRKTAKLLDFRLVLAPVCRDHTEIDGEEIERRVLLACRQGEIIKRGFL